MESFEALVNLLVVLTALSVAAERITNLMKLRRTDLSVRRPSEKEEKQRERSITFQAFVVGVFIALLVKANFFEILTHLDSPWATLGWVQVEGSRWVRSPSTAAWGTFLYTCVGCLLTGTALGFGSKFWHEVLDIVFEVRELTRRHRKRIPGE